MTAPCPACGADPRFLSISKTRTAKAIEIATAELRRKLKAANKPVIRDELVDINEVVSAINAQRKLGWSMAKLTFSTVEALIAEIEDLRG